MFSGVTGYFCVFLEIVNVAFCCKNSGLIFLDFYFHSVVNKDSLLEIARFISI